MTQALRDENRIPVALGQSNTDSTVTLPFLIDSVTGRVLVDSSSSSFSVLTATGDVDDVNTTFTFASEPTLVVVNGNVYRNTKGVTISGTTVTTDSPVGTGGDIYGLA